MNKPHEGADGYQVTKDNNAWKTLDKCDGPMMIPAGAQEETDNQGAHSQPGCHPKEGRQLR